jgi:toxin ParE1/3/4
VRLVWSPQSVSDISALRAFIAAESPVAAKRISLRIVDTVELLLPFNPEAGRKGRVPKTRELVIGRTPFVVAYRINDKAIEVLRVFHGSRRWPDRL